MLSESFDPEAPLALKHPRNRHLQPLSSSQDRILAGIGLMLVAMFAFSLNDVMGKWLVAT